MKNPNTAVLAMSLYLREMKASDIKQLCLMLDPDRNWKNVAARIKNRRGMLHFGHDQIVNIEQKCGTCGKSPTREMITSWMTDNPMIGDLFDILIEIQHIRAAEYIHKDILHRGPLEHLERFPEPMMQPTQNQIQVVPKTLEGHHSEQPAISIKLDIPDSIDHVDEHQEYHMTQVKVPVTSQENGATLNDVDKNTGATYGSLHGEQTLSVRDDNSLVYLDVEELQVHRFTSNELKKCTNNFDDRPVVEGGHLVGEGGFGKVYRGICDGFPEMAVKRLDPEQVGSDPVTRQQFTNEIDVLAKCSHENLLLLIGYSNDQDQCCIVYEYMPNGSLEERLACENKTPPLDIDQRLSIVTGVARGLVYLHNKTPPLVHRDIKSANILLDENFVAKIGDCGTVRLGPRNQGQTHTVTSAAIGTTVYMAPEYRDDNEVSVKLDAYSFGVVLLEILTGLPVYDESREDRSLTTHVNESIDDESGIMTLLDTNAGRWPESLALTIYRTAIRLFAHKRRRPLMSELLPDIEQWCNSP